MAVTESESANASASASETESEWCGSGILIELYTLNAYIGFPALSIQEVVQKFIHFIIRPI